MFSFRACTGIREDQGSHCCSGPHNRSLPPNTHMRTQNRVKHLKRSHHACKTPRESVCATTTRAHARQNTNAAGHIHTHTHTARRCSTPKHTKDSSKPPPSHGVEHRHTPLPHPSTKKSGSRQGDRIPLPHPGTTARTGNDATRERERERESQTATTIRRRLARTYTAADDCVWSYQQKRHTEQKYE